MCDRRLGEEWDLLMIPVIQNLPCHSCKTRSSTLRYHVENTISAKIPKSSPSTVDHLSEQLQLKTPMGNYIPVSYISFVAIQEACERRLPQLWCVRKTQSEWKSCSHPPTAIGSSISSTLTTFRKRMPPFLLPLRLSMSSSSKTTPGVSRIRKPRSRWTVCTSFVWPACAATAQTYDCGEKPSQQADMSYLAPSQAID